MDTKATPNEALDSAWGGQVTGDGTIRSAEPLVIHGGVQVGAPDLDRALDHLIDTVEKTMERWGELYMRYIPQSQRPYEEHHDLLRALLGVERARK